MSQRAQLHAVTSLHYATSGMHVHYVVIQAHKGKMWLIDNNNKGSKLLHMVGIGTF